MLAIASSRLADAVRNILPALVEAGRQRATAEPATEGTRWFTLLKPSVLGEKATRSGDVASDLKPVLELQDSEQAVTCICFGQESANPAYILLAAASTDGQGGVYRCYRNGMELELLTDSAPDEAEVKRPPEQTRITIHSRLEGHTAAITDIIFNSLEDQLVTTSTDKTVRVWLVDSGEMLNVFPDSSPVQVASFLPTNPSVLVAANSDAILRLLSVQSGAVLQELRVETDVMALAFDDTGFFLFAGMTNGSLHVFEAAEASPVEYMFKLSLSRGSVTCKE